MKKFDYKNWIIENKYGKSLSTEQRIRSPRTGQTPNAHDYVSLSACDCDQPNTYWCQAVMNYGTINIPGIDIQCDGVMCDMNIHGGNIFTLDTGGFYPTVTGELIAVHTPIYSANPYNMISGGSCPIEGCMDSSYANYDPNATVDDGSCSNCTLSDSDLYNYLINTVPYNNMFNAGQLGQDVTIAHFCEKCNEYMNQQGPTPSTPFDEHCVCCRPDQWYDL
jgi:hypothetical protein